MREYIWIHSCKVYTWHLYSYIICNKAADAEFVTMLICLLVSFFFVLVDLHFSSSAGWMVAPFSLALGCLLCCFPRKHLYVYLTKNTVTSISLVISSQNSPACVHRRQRQIEIQSLIISRGNCHIIFNVTGMHFCSYDEWQCLSGRYIVNRSGWKTFWGLQVPLHLNKWMNKWVSISWFWTFSKHPPLHRSTSC